MCSLLWYNTDQLVTGFSPLQTLSSMTQIALTGK